jgi:DnaJ-class molecular chaperone
MSDADDRKQSTAKRPSKARSSSTDGDGEGDSYAEDAHESQPCMPCHGSGKVISNLGGHTRKITCPWCRGGGIRLTGVDAQEWQQEQVALKRH